MTMRRTWIKLYIDQTLRGTCFCELNEAERFIWFGFLLLAGDSAWPGVVCATEGTGYSDEQLADLLKTSTELIKVAKKKMVKFKKITIGEAGKIGIVNWQKYQSEYQRQRDWQKEYQQRKTELLQRPLTTSPDAMIREDKIREDKIKKEKDITSRKRDPMASVASEIISFLNQETGRNFSPKGKQTISLISARLKEGFNIGDFKKVIRKKAAKWKEDPEMSQYLRPETLFSAKHFESYLNEPDIGADEKLRQRKEKPPGASYFDEKEGCWVYD